MAKRVRLISTTDDAIIDKIYLVRGKKVMIDRDLAALYQVETKRLKEAVKRNQNRFPRDFMFEMNKREFKNWRSQFATSNSDKAGLRYAPFCFTEQGVTMLSCILSSETAIAVNIRIIRIFTRLREVAVQHKDILVKIEEVEKKVAGHDSEIRQIFGVLKSLFSGSKPQPRRRIGFRRNHEDDEFIDKIAVDR